MKNIMKQAHQMTKEIRKEYPGVDYKFQLGLCLSFLYKNEGVEEDMITFTTERGAKIEVKLEGRTIVDLYINGIELFKNNHNYINCFLTEDKIVINKKEACHKVSKRDTVYIANNEELNKLYKEAIEKEHIESEKYSKESEKKFQILADYEEYKRNGYTIDRHMNDVNAF